jgi:ABC-type spermidine/putrescine transport system permease subunit II
MKKFTQALARQIDRARRLKAAAVVALLAATAGAAHATSAGTFISNINTDGANGIKAAIIIFCIIGVCGIGYGGQQAYKKGGDRGDDITMGKILWPIIGGAICLTIALVAGIVANEMGGSSSNLGQQITPGQ